MIVDNEAPENKNNVKGTAIIWIIMPIIRKIIATYQDHRDPFQNPYAIMKKITINTIPSSSRRIRKKFNEVNESITGDILA